MSKPPSTVKVRRQVEASASTFRTKICTPWSLVVCDGSPVRVLDELEGLTANYQHKVGFRTATADPSFPDSWQLSANVRSANGINTEDFSPSVNKIWIQFCIAAAASSGTGEALASVQGMLSPHDFLVGTRRIEANPDVNAGENDVYRIGRKFPAFMLSKVMLAVIYTGSSSGTPTVNYVPAVRYYNRYEDAGTWSTANFAPSGPVTANERRNFLPTVALTPGPNLWAEVGLSISTATRGTFRVIAMAKYA